MKSSRVVIIAVAFTMVATFYSLSELHRMTTMHAATDTAKFATHDDPNSAIGGQKHTQSSEQGGRLPHGSRRRRRLLLQQRGTRRGQIAASRWLAWGVGLTGLRACVPVV